MQLIKQKNVLIVIVSVALSLLSGFVFLEPWAWMFGQPAIRIDCETTRIVEPLTTDGHVDYVAALNAKYSAGVTPENNAMVLLAQAFGPSDIIPQDRAPYYAMLGIAPLPEQGNYFYASDTLIDQLHRAGEIPEEKLDEAWKMFEQSESRPWSEQEFPRVAAWLDSNKIPLDLAVAASKRPRFYEPAIGATASEISLYWLSKTRAISSALSARAMLRISQRDIPAASADILATARLGQRFRLSGVSIISHLVGFGIHANALDHLAKLSFYAPLSAEDCQLLIVQLAEVSPTPTFTERFDTDDRWSQLDQLQSIARSPDSKANQNWLNQVPLHTENVDWNAGLIEINRWQDRLVDSLQIPNREQRRLAVCQFDDELQEAFKVEASRDPLHCLVIGRAGRGRRIGLLISATFRTAMSALENCRSMSIVRIDLTEISIALAWHRADHGNFPANLDELAPKYLKTIPKDLFGGGDFHYQRTSGGYRLYSNGKNEIDDGGLLTDCDDIVYEFPIPPVKMASDAPANIPDTAPTEKTP